ncbi:MAG: hypothetical protein HY676_00160 [Chloroflexi bacterium]|nr:hypothetical protein [Chloroflexota bacterium]
MTTLETVGTGVGAGVAVDVGVGVGIDVGVGVWVGERVSIDVGTGVADGVSIGIRVGVGVGKGVIAGARGRDVAIGVGVGVRAGVRIIWGEGVSRDMGTAGLQDTVRRIRPLMREAKEALMVLFLRAKPMILFRILWLEHVATLSPQTATFSAAPLST